MVETSRLCLEDLRTRTASVDPCDSTDLLCTISRVSLWLLNVTTQLAIEESSLLMESADDLPACSGKLLEFIGSAGGGCIVFCGSASSKSACQGSSTICISFWRWRGLTPLPNPPKSPPFLSLRVAFGDCLWYDGGIALFFVGKCIGDSGGSNDG